MRLVVALALGTLEPLGTSAAQAPSGDVAPAARALFERTMSPFCPGLTLAVCPSTSADSLRKAIRARLAAGVSASAIEDDLLRTYGDAVRAAPAARGFGLVAWIAPAALLLGAGGWALVWLRRVSGARAAALGTEPLGTRGDALPIEIDAALRARLDAEVRRAG